MNDDFNPGALPDTPDERDYTLTEVLGSAPHFDWSQGYDVEEELRRVLKDPSFSIPVKDQANSSSCGGQAWGYYGEVLEAFESRSFEQRSAKFIYSQTFAPGGGSAGRTNCQLVQKQGWGREALTPSYPATEEFLTRPQDITDAARQDAKQAKALTYAAPALDIDQMAAAIQINKGIILGIQGANNGTWYTIFPKPPHQGARIWRHWLYAGRAKLIDGKKYIGVLNSWGTVCGKNGWQWISEDYILHEGAIFNLWTLVFDKTSLPSSFSHHFTQNLAFGQQSEEVKALQTALRLLQFFPKTAPLSGYFGPITARSLEAFQVAYGISPTAAHHCGPKSRTALNALFNK